MEKLFQDILLSEAINLYFPEFAFIIFSAIFTGGIYFFLKSRYSISDHCLSFILAILFFVYPFLSGKIDISLEVCSSWIVSYIVPYEELSTLNMIFIQLTKAAIFSLFEIILSFSILEFCKYKGFDN
ncbi:MAG: hypothetical protein J6J15_01120 [Oscillospiraceae bacterium]|nr:hypothetical protein [Oscillospiraceae bacterium]